MPEPFLLNPRHQLPAPGDPGEAGRVRAFHRTLAEYEMTPLVTLPDVAADLRLGAVLLKDESSRLGLPAFKMLGASWAVHRALAERDRANPVTGLVTATDGNHGRAVARMAGLVGLSATIVVPRGVAAPAVQYIRDEGATVEVVDADYDAAVRRAATSAAADRGALLVQDTSWPGYEDVPRWIVDGYATLFDEAAEQASDLSHGSGAAVDLVVAPAGVGSLAQAAVAFARRQGGCRVVTVEPRAAACISASIAAGTLTSVQTGQTVMAGLNCGTPSYLAWPDLLTGLAGAAVIDDLDAEAAMADLAACGVDSGPCGAAGLAALRILTQQPVRAALGLTSSSTVLLLNTEGVASAG